MGLEMHKIILQIIISNSGWWHNRCTREMKAISCCKWRNGFGYRRCQRMYVPVLVYSCTVILYVDLTDTFYSLKKTPIIDTRWMIEANYQPSIHPPIHSFIHPTKNLNKVAYFFKCFTSTSSQNFSSIYVTWEFISMFKIAGPWS